MSPADGTVRPHEATDEQKFEPGFGKGGVPWYLLLFYLSFLVFFTWYVLEYQLTDYLEHGRGTEQEAPTEPR